MESVHELKASLPIRHDLMLVYVLSLIIAVLMTVASVTGLVLNADVYPNQDLSNAFVPNDLINLSIGLPLLLLTMWLARRGKLVGLLCWPGALLFILYNYIAYVFAVPLSAIFLIHLALVALCLYTVILLCVSISADKVQHLLRAAVPAGLASYILAPLGIIFFVRAVVVIIGALNAQPAVTESELAVNVADFLITPAWVIGGILLWMKKPFGYVAGLGLLFQASMLFVSLILYMLIQPILTSVPLVMMDVVVVFAMGLICFVPFVFYARGVMMK